MTDKRRLIFSIVDFLNREIAKEENGHSDECKESLEVASQCLQTAFCLSQEDKHLAVSRTLEDIFKEATKLEPLKKPEPASSDDKEKAEKLKIQGNDMMRSENFEKAVDLYTNAIDLDPSNQVFYCNRAAAYSKLNNHYAAVEDCQRAIDMEPSYSKAYGRMGLAYSNLEKQKEAVDSFKKALELEPDNESYKSNLKLAEEKLREKQNQHDAGGAMPNLPFNMMGGGNFDIGSILQNPQLMNMASTMMSDPNMQNMMGQLMSGGISQGSGQSMEGLIQVGQRLAEQMQQSNPELVDQLRRQMQGPSSSNDENKDNPPPGTS